MMWSSTISIRTRMIGSVWSATEAWNRFPVCSSTADLCMKVQTSSNGCGPIPLPPIPADNRGKSDGKRRIVRRTETEEPVPGLPGNRPIFRYVRGAHVLTGETLKPGHIVQRFFDAVFFFLFFFFGVLMLYFRRMPCSMAITLKMAAISIRASQILL